MVRNLLSQQKFISLKDIYLLKPEIKTSSVKSQSSTAVEEAVARAHVTQRARVRFPAGTSFLGEVFWGFLQL